jgi:pyruvate/2-oxoglutarate dehydrogenase complex dihydrolipoamide dehydrogenase (E3) component
MKTDSSTPTAETPFAAVQPLDEHDRALLECVHPPDWVNPEPKQRYHLVVLGAGTGGLVTASIGAALGARVALVERALMGGDCLNTGCVPSKAVIRAANGWAAAREAAARFGGPAATGEGDFAAAMRRMRRIRAQIAPHDSAARFRDLGVDVFLGEGRFTAPDALDVGGRTLRFRRAVVATGARAAVPPVPGLAEAGYLTNETVFSLTEQPESLIIVGAGPIGCELAQSFARLGSRVTLIDMAERVLPRDDARAADVVAEALRRDGVELVLGARLERVERGEAGRTVHYARAGRPGRVSGDALLVATGRAPNVEGIGLDVAGVRHGRAGVEVDDRMRTANPRIYAVGDVASRYQFTHAADAQARMVVQNALFFGRGRASRLVVPWVTYTTPEVAHVGLTAEEARAAGRQIETIEVAVADVDRAKLDGETDGFLRVHLQRGSDRILGATLVSEHAGEIIGQITQAMTTGTGLGALGRAIYPYPTRAEIVRKAADAYRRTKLTPRAKRALELFFRLVR